MKKLLSTAAGLAMCVTAVGSVHAKDDIALVKCEQSFGTIAVVDGDTQGWAKYSLGSPRELINSLALESGCFTPVSPGSSEPANFLMNVIAGDKEEVDQSVEMANGSQAIH